MTLAAPFPTFAFQIGGPSSHELVSKEKALESYKEIKEFVKGTIAENAPIIPVSAIQGVNIDKILQELVEVEITKPSPDEDPLFLVARSFDINKPGTPLAKLHGGILVRVSCVK